MGANYVFTDLNHFNNSLRDVFRAYYIYNAKPGELYKTGKKTDKNNELRFSTKSFGEWQNGGKPEDFFRCDSRGFRFSSFQDFYKFCVLKENNYMLLASILAKSKQNAENPETLKQVISSYYSQAEVFSDAYRNGKAVIENLNRLGMIRVIKTTSFTRSPSAEALFNGLNDDCRKRLIYFVMFASEYLGFGEAGKFILTRLKSEFKRLNLSKDVFRYKHNYIANCLNDCNMLDFMQAAKSGCLTTFKQGRKTRAFLPLKIISSLEDGRQLALGYFPEHRSLGGVDLSAADEIKIFKEVDLPPYADDDIAAAKRLLSECSAFSFPDMFNGNLTEENMLRVHKVKLILRVNEGDGFAYKSAGIRLMCQNGSLRELSFRDGVRRFEYTLKAFDEYELVGFIRKMFGFVEKIEGSQTLEAFMKDDFSRMSRLYSGEAVKAAAPETVQAEKYYAEINLSNSSGAKSKPRKLDVSEKYSGLLFNEAFSHALHAMLSFMAQNAGEAFMCRGLKDVCCIALETNKKKEIDSRVRINAELSTWINGKLSAIADEIIWPHSRNSSSDTGVAEIGKEKFAQQVTTSLFYAQANAVYNQFDTLLFEKSSGGQGACFTVSEALEIDKDYMFKTMPFSALEAAWLSVALDDGMAALFFRGSEINKLKAVLSEAFKGNEFFDNNVFKTVGIDYLDKRSAPKYTDKTRENFLKILEAVTPENRKDITVRRVLKSGKTESRRHIPVNIEFSKRDNRVRIVTTSTAVLLDTVEEVELCDDSKYNPGLKRGEDPYIKVKFNTLEAFERMLSEFAPWERKCSYKEKTLQISYQPDSETEVYSRLLSYGTDIKIIETSKQKTDIKFIQNLIKNNTFK